MASLIAFDLPPFRAVPFWDNRAFHPELCLDVGSTTGAVPPIHPFHNSCGRIVGLARRARRAKGGPGRTASGSRRNVDGDNRSVARADSGRRGGGGTGGPISALKMAATIQDMSSFTDPREFAAFLGLTSKQKSFGRQAEALGASRRWAIDFCANCWPSARMQLCNHNPHTAPSRSCAASRPIERYQRSGAGRVHSPAHQEPGSAGPRWLRGDAGRRN